MNPLEFWWKEDQQVTVINPTDQPYQFKIYGKDYQVGAHKSAKMPGYMAWVYVYGMASQLCQAADKFNRWNEEEFRLEYYQKVVKDVEPLMEEITEEPEPSPIEELGSDDDEPSDVEKAAEELAADEEPDEAPTAPEKPAEEPTKPAETAKPAAKATDETAHPLLGKIPEEELTGSKPKEDEKAAADTSDVKPMQPKAKALRNS